VAWRTLRAWWPALLIAVVIGLLYHDQFGYYWQDWKRTHGYYSHGPLVPLIALYMVWANRKRLASCTVTPAWHGALLLLPAIPLYAFGTWTGSGALVDASLMLTLVGSIWSFVGNKVMRILLFPILYLVFMIPLPGTVLDETTMRIQTQSTRVAAVILNVAGYSSEVVGSNEIHSSDLPTPLVVGVACSGFKLLISLITFTAFFVYMIQAPAWKKAVLVAFAVPLSVFINSLRIAMVGFAGIWTGSADTMHEFHDYSGYLGLVICFLILFGFARLIRANQFGISLTGSSDEPAPPAKRYPLTIGRIAVPLAALLLMLGIGLAVTPLDATAKGTLSSERIVKSFDEWTSEDLPIQESVAKELKTAALLSRAYISSDDGRRVELFMEVARDTDAFHNPMMCIPGSGSGISDTKIIRLKIDHPRPVTVNASLLKISGLDGQDGYIIHWYMIGDQTFPTTSDVRRYMRVLQVQDGYRTVTNFWHRDQVRDEMSKRQAYWYRFYAGSYDSEKTDLASLKSFIVRLVERNPSFGED